MFVDTIQALNDKVMNALLVDKIPNYLLVFIGSKPLHPCIIQCMYNAVAPSFFLWLVYVWLAELVDRNTILDVRGIQCYHIQQVNSAPYGIVS